MWTSQDKKLCINDGGITSARVASDGSLLVSLFGNAITLEPGEDADSLATQLGLDTGQSTPKRADTAKPAEDPPSRHVRR